MGTPASERTRVLPKRVTGTLVQWKGKFGWIQPDEKINHPAASKRGGKVYLAQEDVEKGQLELKSSLSFFVYADENGLGAMQCQTFTRTAKSQVQVKAQGKEQVKAQGKAQIKPQINTYGNRVGVQRTIQKMGNMVQAGVPMIASRYAQAWAGRGFSSARVSGGRLGAWGGVALGVVNRNRSGNVASSSDAARGPAPPPDKSTRERVLSARVTGRLMRWRGSWGFIQPSATIDHPAAEKHRGQVYLHQSDIHNGATLKEGTQVNFFLYADKDGLGAEHCMASKEQVEPTEEELADIKDRGNRRRTRGGRGRQRGGDNKERNRTIDQVKTNSKGRSSMAQRTVALQKSKLKKTKAVNATSANEDSEKKPGGPDLPRERISELPIQGTVLEWRKSHGWIKPSDEIKSIQHDKLKLRRGRIYVHEKDVVSGAPLEKGQSVDFHLYVDESGRHEGHHLAHRPHEGELPGRHQDHVEAGRHQDGGRARRHEDHDTSSK